MSILVTGAGGFIGKNLTAELENRGYSDIFKYDIDADKALLKEYAAKCSFVFHLAGVNRPKDASEYMEGNFGFTGELLKALKESGNKAPVLVSSSIQAELDNPYGLSKKAGEELLLSYAQETGAKVFIYRLPNVFGKWCRPNYNSVVATFCHNIARGLEIKINDPQTELRLVYIDDVVNEFIKTMESGDPYRTENGISSVETVYSVRLGALAEKIFSFKASREDLFVPDLSDAFSKKLYSTYLSYLPKDSFSYELNMHSDDRGSFTEFLKSNDSGQVSVNVIKPGITKGNHWHHTKNEKFLVVKGKGLFRFRKHGDDEIIEYHVEDKKLTVVDIPTGYTHSIVNEGEEDMVVIIWANEVFDPERADTYFEQVEL